MPSKPTSVTCRVWRDGAPSTELAVDQISDELAHPDSLVWVDFVNPTHADLATLADEIGVDDETMEDLVAEHERPKVTRYDSHLFFTCYAAISGKRQQPNASLITLSKISGFLVDGGLVTVRGQDDFDIHRLVRVWDHNRDLLKSGSSALLHGLLDIIVDDYVDELQRLDDAIEELEDQLFEQERVGSDFQRTVFGARKDLVRIRRAVLPMRDVVSSATRYRPPDTPELAAAYDDLNDHTLRAAEWTDALTDMVGAVFDTSLAIQDGSRNTVMKKLAGWAAIIAVPTAITGWFGQNVPYPGFSSQAGLIQSVVLIVVLGVGLYALLRSKDWI